MSQHLLYYLQCCKSQRKCFGFDIIAMYIRIEHILSVCHARSFCAHVSLLLCPVAFRTKIENEDNNDAAKSMQTAIGVRPLYTILYL